MLSGTPKINLTCFQKPITINIKGVSVLMIASGFSFFATETINSACSFESIDINFAFCFSQKFLLCHQSCKTSFR